MNEKQIKIKINEGYLHIRAIVEVLGNPKDYVDETLKGYVKKIEKDKSFQVLKKEFQDPVEQDDLFSAFVELEMLITDSMSLLSFCFDYMPSSVEIMGPTKVIYDSFDFTNFLNDMQARLHAVNMGISGFKGKNENLIKNTTLLMRNFIISILKENTKTSKEISDITGIKEEQMEILLNALLNEKIIIKKGDKYSKR